MARSLLRASPRQLFRSLSRLLIRAARPMLTGPGSVVRCTRFCCAFTRPHFKRASQLQRQSYMSAQALRACYITHDTACMSRAQDAPASTTKLWSALQNRSSPLPSGAVRCAQFVVLFTLVAGVVAAIRARMWTACRNCKPCHGFGIERCGARPPRLEGISGRCRQPKPDHCCYLHLNTAPAVPLATGVCPASTPGSALDCSWLSAQQAVGGRNRVSETRRGLHAQT